MNTAPSAKECPFPPLVNAYGLWFQWLKILFEHDDAKLKKIEDDYRSGALLTGELKGLLIEKLNLFLEEHRKKREKADVEKSGSCERHNELKFLLSDEFRFLIKETPVELKSFWEC
mgnify:CR=1 FL=1